MVTQSLRALSALKKSITRKRGSRKTPRLSSCQTLIGLLILLVAWRYTSGDLTFLNILLSFLLR